MLQNNMRQIQTTYNIQNIRWSKTHIVIQANYGQYFILSYLILYIIYFICTFQIRIQCSAGILLQFLKITI